eukprot:scaffold2052_cov159-Amphora_coffeaeformis.AAC.3
MKGIVSERGGSSQQHTETKKEKADGWSTSGRPATSRPAVDLFSIFKNLRNYGGCVNGTPTQYQYLLSCDGNQPLVAALSSPHCLLETGTTFSSFDHQALPREESNQGA